MLNYEYKPKYVKLILPSLFQIHLHVYHKSSKEGDVMFCRTTVIILTSAKVCLDDLIFHSASLKSR